MKSYQLALFALISALLFTFGYGKSIQSTDNEDNDGPQPRNGVVFFLDDNNDLQPAMLDGVDPTMSTKTAKQNVQFYLYTNKNPTKEFELFVDKKNILQNSHFNKKFATKILIHGFTNSYQSPFAQELKNAYIAQGNINVIIVDWHKLCGAPWYYSASTNTMEVGKYTAQFVDFLVREGKMNLVDLHIIGHSLGAHTSGIVGKHITTGTIGRITGLEAALPLYEWARKKWKLTPEDAEFVDAIHTSAGTLGVTQPIGHVDFYPNGGTSPQPGCFLDITASCSHSRSWEYFIESVSNNEAFPTKECADLYEAQKGSCEYGGDETPKMGDSAFKNEFSISGLYYTKTKKRKPFAINSA